MKSNNLKLNFVKLIFNKLIFIFSISILISCNSKNNKSDNSSNSYSQPDNSSYSQNGTYSYSSGDVELSMTISGDSWTGRTKICEYCDVEYDSGIVYGSDLYDSSGSVKIGNISGNSISTSIGSSRVTLRK